MRKQYDIDSKLLSYFRLETIEEFDLKHDTYLDAKDTQVIVAGSIEKLCLEKLKPLVPSYRDKRRYFLLTIFNE